MEAARMRESALRLIRAVGAITCQCPAHSQAYSYSDAAVYGSQSKEYAFEIACSNIRYGPGVSSEIGMDLTNRGLKKVCLMTDKKLVELPPVKAVVESLEKHGVKYGVYDRVRIEPSNFSFQDAADFAKKEKFDGFVAVGGGSVMDTAKAANLYLCHPENDFMDFVNAPIGKGMPVRKELKPLIAVPTTSGTGSETTGIAVFDYAPLKAKTGIADRALRPSLGIVDPLHAKYMPKRVVVNTGFDVFCHALESFTAIPYTERSPRPANPLMRPAYQGSNPFCDVWARYVLKAMHKYFRRSVKDPEDTEARSQMHLASCFAGFGLGNAGVHLCHGMSYPISGLVRNYQAEEYDSDHPIIPHGLSVVITAPAVFAFTAPSNPAKHLEAAQLLGADVRNVKEKDAGRVLADTVRKYMYDLGVDNGIKAFGFTKEDIPELVKGTLPQKRVITLAPDGEPVAEDLTKLFEQSMEVF